MTTAKETGPEELRVLGVDGDTGRPLSAPSVETLRRRTRRLLSRPRPLRYGIPSHDLRRAGWGFVLAEGADPALRHALEPLLRRRRSEAGKRFRELVYLPEETCADFRGRVRMAHGRVDPRQMPWYLLLVGGPKDIPYGFEADLDVPCAVGRLAFDDLDDLAAYAERVASLANTEPRPGRGLVFAPTHADDPPTVITSEGLARPLSGIMEAHGLPTDLVIGRDAKRARLIELLEAERRLWIFAGHAVQYRPGHRLQRSHQGALLCAEWPGPVKWPEGSPRSHIVAADDLPAGALPGGVALLFGCHTAGAGEQDPYDEPDFSRARTSAPEPFVAALAQRLLGRRGGALGVIGHVGRAFEACIEWRGIRQCAAFEDAVAAILQGRRLGEAVDGFGQRFADLAASWIREQMSGVESTKRDPLNLWIALHDSQSWCLLGDPAVRLPREADP